MGQNGVLKKDSLPQAQIHLQLLHICMQMTGWKVKNNVTRQEVRRFTFIELIHD